MTSLVRKSNIKTSLHGAIKGNIHYLVLTWHH